jgi:2-keto-4-pentenoate hydratase/2-oxohepta-3-ene-1,7-dioic acid hydratase in catechol pathway
MRLLRYEHHGLVHLGALKGDGIISLDDLKDRFPTVQSIAAGGSQALRDVAAYVSTATPTVQLSSVRLLAPIERPGKYLAIGMNYRKHVAEAERLGVAPPTAQLWFNKQTSCMAGPFDKIEPGVTEKLDYEVELGVVIGLPAKGAKEADSHRHVFGYLVANDVSARDWQRHSPTFTVGKSFDTHGPIGPWVVTADEIPDPHRLKLRCFVNGELRQDSTTAEMVYDIWQQISYLSTAFTLETGDLIATGTPEGVGAAMTPPRFLKSGDVVRCEIEGIGRIENVVA